MKIFHAERIWVEESLMEAQRRKEIFLTAFDCSYKGQWKHDLPHGFGVFSDGSMTFEGTWSHGEYDGYGRHQDEHGMYVGEFKNGVRHGKVCVF
jgi:hypothetical protein